MLLRTIRTLGCALLALSCASCLIGFAHTVDYRLVVAATRNGPGQQVSVALRGGTDPDDLTVTDQMASFQFEVKGGRIDLTVRNAGGGVLRPLPAEGKYIDVAGHEHELYAAGRKNRGPAPDRVDPGAQAGIFLWARDWMREDNKGNPIWTWGSDSPFDRGMIAEESEDKALALGRPYLGHTFAIVLPMEANGTRFLYRFVFTAREILPRRMLWA